MWNFSLHYQVATNNNNDKPGSEKQQQGNWMTKPAKKIANEKKIYYIMSIENYEKSEDIVVLKNGTILSKMKKRM